MTIVGYFCLIVSTVWILYKIYVSYTSFGGTIMATVYDAAIYPPALTIFGLYWVLRSQNVSWAFWLYALVWVGLTAGVAIAIRVAEDLGDHRR